MKNVSITKAAIGLVNLIDEILATTILGSILSILTELSETEPVPGVVEALLVTEGEVRMVSSRRFFDKG